MWLETIVCFDCDYEEKWEEDDIFKPIHCHECGDVLDVVEREWLGETILRSTVQCERCNFLFDHLDFQLGLSECPSCFSKELKLVKQKKEIVE